MNPDRLKVICIVLVTSCSLSACSGTSGGDTVATSIPDGSLLEEAFGPGDFMLPDPTVGLAELLGYRASLTVTFDGTSGGESQQWSSTTVLLRTSDPMAAQVVVENSGELAPADPGFLAEAGGTEYRRDAAGVCTAQALGEGASLVSILEPAGALAGVIGAEAIGQRVIAGIEADGYGFDERGVGQAGLATTTGEVWVAAEGGYILEYTLTSEGGDALFGEGTEGIISWHYELTDVGTPDAIEVPDDCPPGLVDAPLLADASDVVSVLGLLSYHSGSTVAEVLAFYEEVSGSLGWTASGDSMVGESGGAAEFLHGDDLVTVVVLVREVGATVYVVVGAPSESGIEPGGVGAQGGITFEMTGGHEITGSWEFAGEFSFFGGGSWTLTFTDPDNPLPEGSFLTLMLSPGSENLSFSDGSVTILEAGPEVCTFAIEHQDASGAAGTVTCTGVEGVGVTGIDISASFEIGS